MGVKDKTILDDQFSASSYSSEGVGPHKARLDGPRGWFCGLTCDARAWLQVDLLKITAVSGLILQGRNDGAIDEWISKYKIQYQVTSASSLVYILDSSTSTPKVNESLLHCIVSIQRCVRGPFMTSL